MASQLALNRDFWWITWMKVDSWPRETNTHTQSAYFLCTLLFPRMWFTMGKTFLVRGGKALDQTAQRCYGNSFSGEISNPPVSHNPGQSSLADPILAVRLEHMILRGPFQPQHSVIWHVINHQRIYFLSTKQKTVHSHVFDLKSNIFPFCLFIFLQYESPFLSSSAQVTRQKGRQEITYSLLKYLCC